MCLMGIYNAELAHGMWPALAVFGASGIVLGAWYFLTLLLRVFFGPLKEPEVAHDTAEPHQKHRHLIGDLNLRELLALAPIIVACLMIGLYSQPFFDTIHPDMAVVDRIVEPNGENMAKPAPTLTRAPGVTQRGEQTR